MPAPDCASPDAWFDWLRDAKPGDEFRYAYRYARTPAHAWGLEATVEWQETLALVRKASRSGRVELFQRLHATGHPCRDVEYVARYRA